MVECGSGARGPTTSAGLIAVEPQNTFVGQGCALPVPARVGRCAACAARAFRIPAGRRGLASATYAGTGMAPATSAPPPRNTYRSVASATHRYEVRGVGDRFAAEDAVVDAIDPGARLKVLRRVAATLAVLSYPRPAHTLARKAATSPNDFPRRPPCCAICAASAGSFEMRVLQRRAPRQSPG